MDIIDELEFVAESLVLLQYASMETLIKDYKVVANGYYKRLQKIPLDNLPENLIKMIPKTTKRALGKINHEYYRLLGN